MLTKQAADYCIKKGFVDECIAVGINKEAAVDQMMKYAGLVIMQEQKQASMRKRALSDMEIQQLLSSMGIQATPEDVKAALAQQGIDLMGLSAADLQGMLA